MSKLIRIGSFSLLAVMAAVLLMSNAAHSENETPERLLRHVVLFKFKESSSEEEVQKVVDAFRALPDKIPQVHGFEYGTNNSPEGLDAGFTHAILMTFKSEADRDAYLPHPAHQEFIEILKPHMGKALVVDYWAKK